ncbi:MAG: DUF2853 family protein [Verrucomicrobiota bacterium]
MSAEENIEKSKAQLTELGVSVDDALLEKIVKGFGIANNSLDASLVSASDKGEMDTLKSGFMTKKLGLEDDAEKDAAASAVMEKMKQFKQKRRGAVCYLLTVDLGKESAILG